MKRIEWNDVWQTALLIITLAVAFVLLRLFTSEKKVQGYYLSSKGTDGSQEYQIMVDIDNTYDYPISVERSVSLDSTITLIEKLNKTIK